MKIQNVKGGYDFLPKEQKIRNYINEVLKETFMEYGYGSIETPILCYLDMLVDKYDENNDLLKEIYKLSDQGGRELGLRYDLTVPFAKFIALNKNNISMPFKRYEIAKVFRDGPVKVGRDREFTQCDADVVGIEGQFIEAELRTYLIEIAIENEQIDKLLMLFKMDVDKIKDMLKDSTNEELTLGIKEIDTLKGYLEKLGYGEICKVDLTLARGQDYYTGNVFEVYDKSGYLTSSIGGGGRYDKMVTEYINDGEVYPAVGISFGLTSIYEILKTRDDFKNTSDIKFYIIPMGVDMEALSLADTLRSYGYNVDVEMKGRKLKKSLDFANRENIPYVIIVGEDEVKSGKVTVKDMINQNNFEIDLKKPEKVKEIVKL